MVTPVLGALLSSCAKSLLIPGVDHLTLPALTMALSAAACIYALVVGFHDPYRSSARYETETKSEPPEAELLVVEESSLLGICMTGCALNFFTKVSIAHAAHIL